MIDHVWSVLCARSVTDNRTNTVSLFNVLEQIQIASVQGVLAPGLLPAAIELVSLWTRSEPGQPARGSGRIEVVLPDGSVAVEQAFDVDLSGFERLRTQAALSAIPIVGPGRYVFRISKQLQGEEDWVEVARIPLQIDIISAPPTAPATPAPLAGD